jgi:hypothetical protein
VVEQKRRNGRIQIPKTREMTEITNNFLSTMEKGVIVKGYLGNLNSLYQFIHKTIKYDTNTYKTKANTV